VSQQVLDGHQLGIGIEQLGGHGVSKLVAGYPKASLSHIVLHPLLDAPDREGLASVGSLLHYKDLLGPGDRSHPEVGYQGLQGITAHIHDPAFAPLAVLNGNPCTP